MKQVAKAVGGKLGKIKKSHCGVKSAPLYVRDMTFNLTDHNGTFYVGDNMMTREQAVSFIESQSAGVRYRYQRVHGAKEMMIKFDGKNILKIYSSYSDKIRLRDYLVKGRPLFKTYSIVYHKEQCFLTDGIEYAAKIYNKKMFDSLWGCKNEIIMEV